MPMPVPNRTVAPSMRIVSATASKSVRCFTGPVSYPPAQKVLRHSERETTSFMISLVPPKMRVTRASRQSLAIRYSFM